MIIEKDRVVTVAYQIFALQENGEAILVDSKQGDDSPEFLFGHGHLLSKIEDLLNGKARGYHLTVDLHPRDAYGVHDPSLEVWMARSKFPSSFALKVGMKFQTQGPKGDVLSVMVKEITDEKVLVDGNHPLAGVPVRFDLKVIRVREATSQEKIQKSVDPKTLH